MIHKIRDFFTTNGSNPAYNLVFSVFLAAIAHTFFYTYNTGLIKGLYYNHSGEVQVASFPLIGWTLLVLFNVFFTFGSGFKKSYSTSTLMLLVAFVFSIIHTLVYPF